MHRNQPPESLRKTEKLSDYRFCIAPMMDWSDRHCRFLWRLMSAHVRLYTEMVTTGALVQGKKTHFLDYNSEEHPIALQVGGSHPGDLARCAELAEQWGYDEINLNCGCPSDRVQSGKIGAILMAEPDTVARCVDAMQAATKIPVTVKHRIGIDDMEDYAGLRSFVSTVAEAGCRVFIVHARKAWLKGLSPKENREIPPLRYELVHRLKDEFPELTIVLNGGILSVEEAKTEIRALDGVMVGRAAYHDPYGLACVDKDMFGGSGPVLGRDKIFRAYMVYCGHQLEKGLRLHFMTRHALGLYQGQPGARRYRRILTQGAQQEGAGLEVMEAALGAIISARESIEATEE